MQQLAWWLTSFGVAALAAVFLAVARDASRRAEPVPAARSDRVRARLFAAAGAVFIPVTALSLGALPYGAAPGGGALVVDAVGHQWYWELSHTTLPAGRDVVFRVRSADVNHGFALYDPDLRMVGQTQAMPGYENLLALRLDRAGTYRILCLEYCGSVHHGMQATLEVTAEAP